MHHWFGRSLRIGFAGLVLLCVTLSASLASQATGALAAAVTQTISVGNCPQAVSADGTYVWVANYCDSSVTELNSSTGSIVQTIHVGRHPIAISSDRTHVW